MRISAIQKDVLYVLAVLEGKKILEPVPLVKILTIVNAGRSRDIHTNNFRVSCHTLVDNGLLQKYRSRSLHLAFTLSESGRQLAGLVRAERDKAAKGD